MTIRHLRIFIAVAETGNMSATAAKFFISQPTVSQIISELEKHYNVKLFERLPRKLYITDAGKALLSHATSLIEQFDKMEYRMLHSFQAQPLKIGATLTVGTCLISDMISDFHREYPQLRTEVFIDNTRRIENKLLDMDLDLAIVEGKIKSPELNVTPMIDDYLVLICGNEHPFAARDSVELSELKAEDFILREEGSGTREMFESYMKMKGFPISPSWVSTNTESIKRAVIDNQGLSVISIRLVEQELREGLIQLVNIRECVWNRKFCLVYNNKFLSEEMKKFITTAKNYKNDDILKLLPYKL